MAHFDSSRSSYDRDEKPSSLSDRPPLRLNARTINSRNKPAAFKHASSEELERVTGIFHSLELRGLWPLQRVLRYEAATGAMLVETQMSDEVMLEHLPPRALQTVGEVRLAKLLKALIEARKQFDPNAHDHGRSNACHALRALIDYVSDVADTRPDIVVPLRELLWGLKNLDDGTVVGLLEAKKLANRAPDSAAVKAFRASAAVLMQLKHEQGITLAEAAAAVACQLNRRGYRDRGQRITAKRVTAWREAVTGMADQDEIGVGRYRFALKLIKGRFPDNPKAGFDCYLDMMPDIDRPDILEKPPS